MPFSKLDRKAALMRAGQSMQQVADACEVDLSTVSHCMAGRKLTGPAAARVMAYVAALVGAPIAEVFPGAVERRGGPGRRETDRSGDAAA